MSSTIPTANIKLVTIIAPYENADSFGTELKALGVTGYTSTTADGRGLHGPRHYGLLDGANVRIEVLAAPEVARRILEHVALKHVDEAVLAFSVDAEAVPRSRFV